MQVLVRGCEYGSPVGVFAMNEDGITQRAARGHANRIASDRRGFRAGGDGDGRRRCVRAQHAMRERVRACARV